jgi:hypothetical protein
MESPPERGSPGSTRPGDREQAAELSGNISNGCGSALLDIARVIRVDVASDRAMLRFRLKEHAGGNVRIPVFEAMAAPAFAPERPMFRRLIRGVS